MCGIAGIYKFKGKAIEAEKITALTKALRHRGPDGDGIWFDDKKNLALGHRRLSILDLSDKAAQPMVSEDKKYIISYNGEIYNFLELRQELAALGHKFRTESDTEVIIEAYREWGVAALDKFNGMWALALYDNETGGLLLSRDRFGIKPLYYYSDQEQLIFSSEVRAIHKLIKDRCAINDKVVKVLANGSFAPHGTAETYIKNIYSLPAGHNLVMAQNQPVKISRWYRLKKVSLPEDFNEQTKMLRSLIVDACRLRLRSDVSIGTCLSGGLDSGSISAVINNLASENERFNNYSHRGFCASFPGSPIDEAGQARELAEKLKLRLDVLPVACPAAEELEAAMRGCDGPMHSLAFYPIWKLYSYIRRQGIIVTLDGQGPDEMLGGYRPLKEALIASIQNLDPGWFVDLLATYAAQGETAQFSARRFAAKTLLKLPLNLLRYLPGRLARITAAAKGEFKGNYFDETLYNQSFKDILPGILNQYDRCSMAHGVECRMPFLDYRIVEMVFSLPPRSKVGHGYTKRILREALKGILPDETRLRKTKIGFNAPIVDWFRGDLRDWMLGQMSSPEFLESEYFDGRKIKKRFEKFLKKKAPQWDEAWEFWPPVHLAWWLKYNDIK